MSLFCTTESWCSDCTIKALLIDQRDGPQRRCQRGNQVESDHNLRDLSVTSGGLLGSTDRWKGLHV